MPRSLRPGAAACEQAALAYAERGWPVFPCASDKRPLTAHGFKDAADGESAVRRLWRAHAEANVAIATGEADLVVIDVDVKGGAPGRESWAALVCELGSELEDTAAAETPSGGLHLYYRAEGHAVACSAGKLAPGVDVRARGGYVVAPPSTTAAGGAYRWLEGRGPERVAALPSALAARLAGEVAAEKRPAPSPASAIVKGQRNAALTSLAGVMRARGMGEASIHAALQVENASRCEPPLADDELRAIAASIAGYAPSLGAGTRGNPLAPVEALAADADLAAIEAALREAGRQAGGLDPLAKETLRERAIAWLKERKVASPARLVDAALSLAAGAQVGAAAGGDLLVRELEAWPEPVAGPQLLSDLALTLRRYVILDQPACLAVALWIVLAHCYESFSVLPLLALTSAVKRSGKTLLLTLVGTLVPRPLPASNISPAALYRSVEKYGPTLLIDEVDTFLRDNAELNGILNSGHTRSMAHVVRSVGDDHEPRCFSTWCPKVYAGIGRQRGTLEDRAIMVGLRRRAPGEQVERLRLDRLAEFEPLRRRAARWAADHGELLRSWDPQVPEITSDRAVDNWRPLLAIAEAVGGGWPERARAAALALADGPDDEGDARVLLLGDLRELFAADKAERLSSSAIVAHLEQMEERPWPEWRAGKAMSARQLAKLLEPFGVTPKTLRFADGTRRGYELAQLADVFARYLPSAGATSATCLQTGTFSGATGGRDVAQRNVAKCRDVALVADGEQGWSEEL